MQLKYLKGDLHHVYMGEGGKPYRFSPIGEIPDNFAKHLLKTRPNDFEIYVKQSEVVEEIKVEEVVEAEKFKCDQCDYESTSNAGLSAHKRFKHKEK